jgi:anti-sigma regulatory factor (Ser/Thr protein kinase)
MADADSGLADVTANVESVFAEVAANAVAHGRGHIRVTVTVTPHFVRCDIRDRGWRAPERPSLWRPGAETGRGMTIVCALADAWGVRRHVLGKTVWFVVRRQP